MQLSLNQRVTVIRTLAVSLAALTPPNGLGHRSYRPIDSKSKRGALKFNRCVARDEAPDLLCPTPGSGAFHLFLSKRIMWWIVLAVAILGVLLFETERTKKITNQLIMVIGAELLIFAIFVLSAQCAFWVKIGRWKSVSMARAFSVFEVPIPHPTLSGPTGLQDVVDWIGATFLNLPANLTLLVLGLLVFCFGKRRSKGAIFPRMTTYRLLRSSFYKIRRSQATPATKQ